MRFLYSQSADHGTRRLHWAALSVSVNVHCVEVTRNDYYPLVECRIPWDFNQSRGGDPLGGFGLDRYKRSETTVRMLNTSGSGMFLNVTQIMSMWNAPKAKVRDHPRSIAHRIYSMLLEEQATYGLVCLQGPTTVCFMMLEQKGMF